MNKIPQTISQIRIKEKIFQNTIEQLRLVGKLHKEGIAYWSGKLENNQGIITNVMFADDYPEFYNEKLFASVSLDMSFRIGEKIHQRNEILFAQIHTHPSEAFHSYVDDNYPISHRRGFLSIVMPDFAKNVTSLLQCKIYEYEGKGNWKEFTQTEILNRFKLQDDE